jgi:acyl carrier protein
VARLELEEGGAPRLVAFFAHVPGQSFTDTELRRQLRALLPEFMVPQVFIELESLPITSDGAIDYAGLPAPFGSDRAIEFVAPRSATEQRLAEIFAEALRVPRVGVYDNFFDLGGHSLLCFRVIERIERELGKRLSPRTLLLNSLEQVASELDGGAQKAEPSPRPAARAPEEPRSPGGLFKRLQGFLKR